MEDNIPIPLDGYIQHHTAVSGIFPFCQQCQLVQLAAFQLSHKAHGTDIHTQNRNSPLGGSLRHMKNGTVAAKTDHHFRIGQFPVQTVETDIPGQLIAAVNVKGQTNPGIQTGCFQNLHSISDCLEILIPVRVGSQNDIFH